MLIRSALLALLAGCALPLAAQAGQRAAATPENGGSALVISPIFSQLVAFKMPLDFHVVSEETSAHGYIREAVPKGETAEAWTQMITVTGYKDVAADPGPPPAVLLNSIAAGFKKACPDTISVGDLGSPPIDGYPASMAYIACGKTDNGGNPHSEAALVLAIKGKQDYYTLQWATRGKAQASPVAFDQKAWVGRLGTLMPVFLCDKVPGEQAPYPSCSARTSGDDESSTRSSAGQR